MKAIIFKASLEFADLDHQIYRDHQVTLARHPSETDERLIVRLLAFALYAPKESDQGDLLFAKDLWNIDEPCLWQKDYTNAVVHWIEVGQPDEKRLLRVCARSEKVTVVCYDSSAPIWWEAVAPKLTRARNLTVVQIPSEESMPLAQLAQRTMRLHVAIQEGMVWMSDDQHSLEIHPATLRFATSA